jgi:hypothetical protein
MSILQQQEGEQQNLLSELKEDIEALGTAIDTKQTGPAELNRLTGNIWADINELGCKMRKMDDDASKDNLNKSIIKKVGEWTKMLGTKKFRVAKDLYKKMNKWLKANKTKAKRKKSVNVAICEKNDSWLHPVYGKLRY